MKSYNQIFVILIIAFATQFCKVRPNFVLPEIEKGSIDLSQYSFFGNQLPLKGEWNFYWGEFKTDFSLDEINKNRNFSPVPSHWMELKESSNIPTTVFGIATYQIDINLSGRHESLGIRIPPMDTAFVLFWNGKEIARNGNIYKERGDIYPIYYAPIIKELTNVNVGINYLHLHMANSIYPRPGLRDAIVLGEYSELYQTNQKDLFTDIFLSGSLFLVFIYHLGLWLLRRKDISTFYFTLLSFLMVIRISVTGEAFVYKFFPMSWKLSTFLEYLSFYMAGGSLILFIRSLYPKDGAILLDRLALAIIVIFSSIVILFPLEIYTRSLAFFQIMIKLIGIYVFVILGLAIKNKRESSVGFMFATSIFMLAFINDMLYSQRMIESTYIISFGIFTFFFAQAFLLSQRFAKAFETAEVLTRELDQKVQERTQALENEMRRSDDLLKNILPDEIADELKHKGTVAPMYFQNVTVMFIDFVEFTKISEYMKPYDLVAELDECFRAFDEIIEKNNLEKLKTIGDSYMCVSGLPIPNPMHAIQCCEAALEIRSWMKNYQSRKSRAGWTSWNFRIGIHSGPVTAGVIGSKKFAYDIWGDTVNVASRMESHGETGEINISEETFKLIQDKFICKSRGNLTVKGKGNLTMYCIQE